MSTIVIMGHLGNEAKVTNLQQDRNVINFSIAENLRKINKETGEVNNITQWFNCSYFVKSTKVAEYLKKGRRVFVVGTIEFEEFTSNSSNKVQRSNNILVQSLHIIDFDSKEENFENQNVPVNNFEQSKDDLPF